jgi:hypothetical protein
MSVAPASHVSSWSRPIWYHAGPPPSGTYDAIPPTPPPPPPPYGPVLQKVWILDCRSCGKFLTNRGMKASALSHARCRFATSNSDDIGAEGALHVATHDLRIFGASTRDLPICARIYRRSFRTHCILLSSATTSGVLR